MAHNPGKEEFESRFTEKPPQSYRDIMRANDDKIDDRYSEIVDGVDAESDAYRAINYNGDR